MSTESNLIFIHSVFQRHLEQYCSFVILKCVPLALFSQAVLMSGSILSEFALSQAVVDESKYYLCSFSSYMLSRTLPRRLRVHQSSLQEACEGTQLLGRIYLENSRLSTGAILSWDRSVCRQDCSFFSLFFFVRSQTIVGNDAPPHQRHQIPSAPRR